jgi:hypothetical protein
MNGLRYEI